MPDRRSINPERLVGGSDQSERIRKALDQQGPYNPDLREQLGPVILTDDVSGPPFTARPIYWAVPLFATNVAAQFSHIGMVFAAGTPGVCVVDEFGFNPGAASFCHLRFSLANAAALAATATIVFRVDQGRTNTVALAAPVATQFQNAAQQGTALQYASVGATGPTVWRGPWTLLPGNELYVVCAAVNQTIIGWARGRYWPDLNI